MNEREWAEATRRLKTESDLPALAEEDGVKLTGGPNEFKGRCPFHDDSTPSLSISRRDDSWLFNCFGCNVGGDVFKWLEMKRGLTFIEARRHLSQKLGIPLPAPPRMYPGQSDRDAIEDQKPRGKSQFNVQALTDASAAAGYLRDQRKIPLDVCRQYHVGETTAGDWIAFQYQWWPPRWKDKSRAKFEFCKMLEVRRKPNGAKHEVRDPAGGRSVLFGMTAAGASGDRLVICEGEIDALSWAAWGIPAVSVPGGAKYVGWIDTCWEWLQEWKKIFISFDEDAAGRAKVVEVVTRLGITRTDIVRLPERPDDDSGARFKDANECLQAGFTAEEMDECLRNTEVLRPPKLKDAYDLEDDIWQKLHPSGREQMGLVLPWGNFHKSSLPFRIKYGELSVWSGYNKHGKSEVLNHVMVDLAWQGEKVLIVSLEVAAAETYRKLIRMSQGKRQVIDRDSRDLFRAKCLAPLAGKIWVYDQQGDAPLEEVLEVMTYAYQRYGVRQFVLDSLMRFQGLDGEGQQIWNRQKEFMDRLLEFVQVYQVHVHLVAHSKKPDKGGDTKMPRRYDVMGSAYITNLAFNVIIVWRNKAKQEKLQAVWQAAAAWWVTNMAENDPMPVWKRLMGGEPSQERDPDLWKYWDALRQVVRKLDPEIQDLFDSLIAEPDAHFLVDVQRGEDGDTVSRNLWFDPDSLQFLEANSNQENIKPGDPRSRPRRYVEASPVETDIPL